MQFTKAQRAKFRSQMAARQSAKPAPLPGVCPQCGSGLGVINQYVGGRGYQPYTVCSAPGCSFMRRA